MFVTTREVKLRSPLAKHGWPTVTIPADTEVVILGKRLLGSNRVAIVRYGSMVGWVPLDALKFVIDERETPS